MHQVGFDRGDVFPGRSADRLRRQLEEQELMLHGVASQLDEERHLLDLQPGVVEWSGPAQLLYMSCVGRLSADLASAAAQLEIAIRETRWAIDSRENHG